MPIPDRKVRWVSGAERIDGCLGRSFGMPRRVSVKSCGSQMKKAGLASDWGAPERSGDGPQSLPELPYKEMSLKPTP